MKEKAGTLLVEVRGPVVPWAVGLDQLPVPLRTFHFTQTSAVQGTPTSLLQPWSMGLLVHVFAAQG